MKTPGLSPLPIIYSQIESKISYFSILQAETCGGLAVCQPLTRISNHHHYQGESPAEEVHFPFLYFYIHKPNGHLTWGSLSTLHAELK